MIGRRLGHYEIVGRLGQGGMGEVYEARDTRLDRSVAIKILSDRSAGDRDASARFDREAKSIAALSHPSICALFDVGNEGTTRYLVMEHIQGPTLAERIRQQPFSTAEAVRYGAQIAEALAAAHAQGIIHRDLKPANVMLVPGRAKVLDFGLAKIPEPRQPASLDATTLLATSPYAILGTAPYMSPEQACGEVADHRTDIWSFGVLLYEMLTGRPLFTARNPADAFAAILKARIDFGALPADVPPAVRELMVRLLQRDREHRPYAMAEVAAILAGAGPMAGEIR